jgi:serine/threonine-protein kinase
VQEAGNDPNLRAILGGKWRVDELIGAGGTARVYAAHHDRIGNRVAVKILSPEAGISPKKLARFQREGYVANKVGHPGAVQILDGDIDAAGRAFLVMELLAGETIAARAARNGMTLPPDEVLEVADRLLDVLAAAHDRSILHRDIKPENLFMTDAGVLKVLDFGIARLSELDLGSSKTEAGTVLGSPAFMAPEQARGRVDDVDPRTDLWAVGATMFTLLTGRFVLALAMVKAAQSLGAVAPQMPDALVGLVDRALAYDRDRRWSDARAMQEAVRHVRSGGEIPATAFASVASSPSAAGDSHRSPTTLPGEDAGAPKRPPSGAWQAPTTISVESTAPSPSVDRDRTGRRIAGAAALALVVIVPVAAALKQSASTAPVPATQSVAQPPASNPAPPPAVITGPEPKPVATEPIVPKPTAEATSRPPTAATVRVRRREPPPTPSGMEVVSASESKPVPPPPGPPDPLAEPH